MDVTYFHRCSCSYPNDLKQKPCRGGLFGPLFRKTAPTRICASDGTRRSGEGSGSATRRAQMPYGEHYLVREMPIFSSFSARSYASWNSHQLRLGLPIFEVARKCLAGWYIFHPLKKA